MKFVVAAIAVLTVCVSFAGCMDDTKDLYKGKDSEEPNTFDYSTKKTVEFNLKYDVPVGYRVRFEMYTKSPITLDAYKSYVKDSTLVSFFSGSADENGNITYKGDLPATVKEIYSYSSGFGVPVLMKASVNDAGGVSEFKETAIPTASSTRNATCGASGTNLWETFDVTLNKPKLTPISKKISIEDKNLIEKSFPSNQAYGEVGTYYQSAFRLTGDAKVKIYSVSNGTNSNRTNALAYFTYKEKGISPSDINSKLNLAFPVLNKTIPAEGEGYQLLYNGEETFKANTYIGFALLPDVKSSIATTDVHVLHSCYSTASARASNGDSWNAYKFPPKKTGGQGLVRANVPHMVMSHLRTDENGHAIIAIAFEDQPWSTTYGTNKGDFRDDIFILEVDPASSLPDLPTPPTDEPDHDYEYNSAGILCFEDCWPNKGDYDINDIVVAYDRTMYVSKKGGPVAMKLVYSFLNNGADFENGFGYQLLGLSKGDIMKCTVESSYSCEGQGLDATMSVPTVMLFDNGKAMPKDVTTTFSVYTSFTNGNKFTYPNPFIVVRGYGGASGGLLSEGRTEVHLPTPNNNFTTPKYLPTTKAITDLWGTSDDLSDPSKGIYYVRKGNYPFALEISWDSKYGKVTDFVVPREKESIEKTYPDFTKWVDSGGKNYTDWFLKPNM